MKLSRRVRWLVLIPTSLVVLLAAAALTVKYLPPYLHRRHVAGLVERFKANPCQRTADPLVELLVNSKVSQEAGDRILGMLLSPKAMTKDSYAVGEEIKIDIAPAYRVKVDGMYGEYERVLHIAGVTGRDGDQGSRSLLMAPDLSTEFRLTMCFFERQLAYAGARPGRVIHRPGTYRGHVQLQYSLSASPFRITLPESTTEKVLAFLGLRKSESESEPRVFRCRHKIPITIRVVDPGSLSTSSSSRPARSSSSPK